MSNRWSTEFQLMATDMYNRIAQADYVIVRRYGERGEVALPKDILLSCLAAVIDVPEFEGWEGSNTDKS